MMTYVTFTEFDRNLNFVYNDILPNVVARLGSHENCNPCIVYFIM
jgi:hypothetical protein